MAGLFRAATPAMGKDVSTPLAWTDVPREKWSRKITSSQRLPRRVSRRPTPVKPNRCGRKRQAPPLLIGGTSSASCAITPRGDDAQVASSRPSKG